MSLALIVLCGCAHEPSSGGRSGGVVATDESKKPSGDEGIARRIVSRVAALKRTYPALERMSDPTVTPDGLPQLYFERGVTWTLEDPSAPAGKRNALTPSFEKDGFWFRLQFYRGPWTGAAVFVPVELGDVKLWFSCGYRPGDNPEVIAAVSRIIDEEKRAFVAGKGSPPSSSAP
jgi:hypothetical protein